VSTAINIEELFILIVPTSSGKAEINTLWRLAMLPQLLGRHFFPVTVTGKGVTQARTHVLEQLKHKLDQGKIEHNGKVRALWWDDDLIIDPQYDLRKLANTIAESDQRGINLIGNYRIQCETNSRDMQNVLMHLTPGKKTRCYTDQEIAGLKNLDPLPDTVSGMGFYYGNVFLDYKFHYDEIAEDVNFFIDQNLELHYSDVQLWHEKKVLI